jgi:hypothetical protein
MLTFDKGLHWLECLTHCLEHNGANLLLNSTLDFQVNVENIAVFFLQSGWSKWSTLSTEWTWLACRSTNELQKGQDINHNNVLFSRFRSSRGREWVLKDAIVVLWFQLDLTHCFSQSAYNLKKHILRVNVHHKYWFPADSQTLAIITYSHSFIWKKELYACFRNV